MTYLHTFEDSLRNRTLPGSLAPYLELLTPQLAVRGSSDRLPRGNSVSSSCVSFTALYCAWVPCKGRWCLGHQQGKMEHNSVVLPSCLSSFQSLWTSCCVPRFGHLCLSVRPHEWKLSFLFLVCSRFSREKTYLISRK